MSLYPWATDSYFSSFQQRPRSLFVVAPLVDLSATSSTSLRPPALSWIVQASCSQRVGSVSEGQVECFDEGLIDQHRLPGCSHRLHSCWYRSRRSPSEARLVCSHLSFVGVEARAILFAEGACRRLLVACRSCAMHSCCGQDLWVFATSSEHCRRSNRDP